MLFSKFGKVILHIIELIEMVDNMNSANFKKNVE